MFSDLYKILEVESTASQEEIKKSYRRLVFIYHPDRTANNKASEEKFKEVQNAYEILINNEKRKSYDYEYNAFYYKVEPEVNDKKDASHKQEAPKPRSNAEIANDILLAFEDLYAKIKLNKWYSLSSKDVYKNIDYILTPNRVSFLISHDNTSLNKSLISLILKCCRNIDYKIFEKLLARLVKLAGSDNDILTSIRRFDKKKKSYNYLNITSKFIVNNFKAILVALGVGYWLFTLATFTTLTSEKDKTNRPASGEIYKSKADSDINNRLTKANIDTIRHSKYEDWDGTNYNTGNTPNCYNFKARYNRKINNRLEVKVGATTDVVIKVINANTNICIRYVYIQSGDTFDIRYIPEGKYYLKIAYGRDWRQKILNGKCMGKFTENPLYKKFDRILDFYKKYVGSITENGREYRNYNIPSFTLTLDIVQPNHDDEFQSNKITEDDFND